MATVTQIINFSKARYPRVNDETEANQIDILNQIMDEVYNKLLRVRWEFDPYEMYTIADQASYTLPTDCTPDNVIKIMVSEDTFTNISDNTIWNEYKHVGLLDNYDVSSGNHYTFQEGIIFLFDDGKPIDTTDLVIRLYYYREPTYISSITDTPEIESKYHNLFKYGLIQMVASSGDNPEPAIADYWQKKFDEELNTALMNLQDKFDNAPLKTAQIEEYW